MSTTQVHGTANRKKSFKDRLLSGKKDNKTLQRLNLDN